MSKIDWYVSPFGHVKYALIQNQKQLNKASKPKLLKFLSISETAQCTYFDEGGKRVCLVELADLSGRTIAEIHGVIVHEAVHVHQQIMECMGEKPSVEFEAYSIQQIVVDLLSSYAENKKESK